MTVQAKLLPFLVLPLCLSSACSENNAQEDILQYSDSADAVPTERAYDRAIVVDGDVIVYGSDGTSRHLNLDIEAFVAHGHIDSTHLLLGANPRAVLPHAEDLGGHDLFLVDLATSSYTQLTSEQEVVRATWNSRRNRVIVSNRNLQITEFGLENPAEVVTLVEGAVTPALSPDGQHLAYGRLPADWSVGSLPESIDLHVLDLDGGSDVELTSGFDDIEPIWTPDGSSLLFLSGARTGVHSFWRVDPTGGIPAQLTNLGLDEVTPDFVPSPAFNTEVAWSDDGNELLFGAHYTETGEVHALDFSADPMHPSLRSFGPGVAPQWQEDGTITAVVVDADEELVLTSIDSENGVRETLVRVAGRLPMPPFAPAPEQEDHTPSAEDLAMLMNGDSPRAADASVRFQFPMNNYYGVNYYYDNNSQGGWAQDKSCGSQSYDGHRGTDFTANYGNNIYAAASGSIYHRVDGCATTGGWGNWCGNGFGNHVRIDHGSGWKTIYGHMTNGTVTGWGWKGCGNYLGVSGSSGNSTGAHLHFEVIRYGYPYDDPYTGPCSGPESYWTNNWSCQ